MHLTGRQLVGELARLGVGTWSADAVRQWIREEPRCPIAEHADQGKPHRYRLADVLTWLRTRALGERAKGFSSGSGPDLVDRLDAALRALSAGPIAAPVPPTPIFAAGAPAAANPSEQASAPPAAPTQREIFSGDPTQKPDVEVLMEILRGRDPRNWRAAEEALNARRKRMVEERQLIPVDELQLALDAQTEHVRSTLAAGVARAKSALRGLVAPDRAHDLDAAIDAAFAAILEKLADVEDLQVDAGVSRETAAPAPEPTA